MKPRILAIDYGRVRLGLAVSDALGLASHPLPALQRTGAAAELAALKALILDRDVLRLVVGLPLNMDGTHGPQARDAVAWSRRLRETMGAPVVFVDERLTSFDAEQQLVARKRSGERITRKSKREQLDALAAATFLQAFLDGKLPAIDVERTP